MGAVGTKLRRAESADGSDVRLMHWCPACEEPHGVRIAGPAPVWGFNEDFNAPSFNPSVRCFTTYNDDGEPLPAGQERTLCHYFIKRGVEMHERGANLDPAKSYIDFCSDSPHTLRGKIVELPDWPYAPGAYSGIED